MKHDESGDKEDD